MLLLKMKSVKTSDYFLPCTILSTFPPSLQFNKMLVFILTSKDSEVHNFKSTAVGSDSFQYYTVTIILNNKKHNKTKSIQLWLLHIIFLSVLSRYLLLTVYIHFKFSPVFPLYFQKEHCYGQSNVQIIFPAWIGSVFGDSCPALGPHAYQEDIWQNFHKLHDFAHAVKEKKYCFHSSCRLLLL